MGYTFIELALILSKQLHTKVSTAMEFISNNKDVAVEEIKNNDFIITDFEYIEKNMKDPNPPKFF